MVATLPCGVLARQAAAPTAPQVAPQGAPKSSLDAVDAALAKLASHIDGYPPSFSDADEKKRVEKELDDLLTNLDKLQKQFPRDAEVERRFGNAYRMAHNLDREGAWPSSESHLKSALALDPSNIQAHLTLGSLYVNTDMKYAPAAEKEFREALRLSGDTPLPGAHIGLVFAYYYQGRFREAVAEADKYLVLRPDDSMMKQLREIALDKAKESEQ